MSSFAGAPVIRIATRKSPLALWQANHIKDRLQLLYPNRLISIVGFTTQGDRLLDGPLQSAGGKGLFVKELEAALRDDRADIAVHSMKDVPTTVADGLALEVICAREDARDAFVSNRYRRLDELPAGGLVGTSSLRRQCQLGAGFPGLRVADLRGNVNTRLMRLDHGDYDGIILAAAGLIRLGLAERICETLSVALSLPAVGQGALGIECRAEDEPIRKLIAPLHHEPSAVCVRAERAVNEHLQGGCQLPIACHAVLSTAGRMHLQAMVGSPDGRLILRDETDGAVDDGPETLGRELAEHLLRRGAAQILRAIH